MTWELAIGLILKYGPVAAWRIIEVIKSSPEVTKEAFDKIIAISQKSMEDYIREAEERAKGRPAPS
jgi:hypothetical protein